MKWFLATTATAFFTTHHPIQPLQAQRRFNQKSRTPKGTSTTMRVMVTGGAGYICSVVTEELLRDGHDVVVYDNLQKGHRQAVIAPAQFIHADLSDKTKLLEPLSAHRVEAVVHTAADSLVGESCEKPAKYYQNNVVA